MRLRRPASQEVGREPLPRERLWQSWHGLRPRGTFAGHGTGRDRFLVDREQWRARLAIEHEDVAVLGGLRHRVDLPAVATDRDQRGGRREVAIPDVVMHRLEVPDATSRRGIERQQAVREQVVADAVGPVEVRRGRSGGHEHDPTRLVECHAGPVVGASVHPPRRLGPGIVAGLVRTRNRVEGPSQHARAHVVRPDVPRRGARAFARASADNQQIAVDDAGRCQPDRLGGGGASEIVAQVDAPPIPEAGNGDTCPSVERIEILVRRHEQAALVTVRPVGHAAVGTAALQLRVEGPLEGARRGIERHDPVIRGWRVEDAVHDDRIHLEPAGLTGVESPGLFEVSHVGGRDLGKRRKSIARGRCTVDPPLDGRRLRRGRRSAGGCARCQRAGDDERHQSKPDVSHQPTSRFSLFPSRYSLQASVAQLPARREAPRTCRPTPTGRRDRSVQAFRGIASPSCSRSPT